MWFLHRQFFRVCVCFATNASSWSMQVNNDNISFRKKRLKSIADGCILASYGSLPWKCFVGIFFRLNLFYIYLNFNRLELIKSFAQIRPCKDGKLLGVAPPPFLTPPPFSDIWYFWQICLDWPMPNCILSIWMLYIHFRYAGYFTQTILLVWHQKERISLRKREKFNIDINTQ